MSLNLQELLQITTESDIKYLRNEVNTSMLALIIFEEITIPNYTKITARPSFHLNVKIYLKNENNRLKKYSNDMLIKYVKHSRFYIIPDSIIYVANKLWNIIIISIGILSLTILMKSWPIKDY